MNQDTFLIDTHILLWYLKGDSRLSPTVINLLNNPNHTIYISKASLWEITIKLSLKKLILGIPFAQLESFLITHNFTILDFTFADLTQLLLLPFHHGDPFDRLIIAQSLANQIAVISDDAAFTDYPVSLVAL